MGAKLGGGGGGFNDINMTPLIDIVLVVLIIMMVSIPIQVNRLGVKVPNPETPPPKNPPESTEQLAVAIYEDGRIALNRKVLVQDSSILLDPNAPASAKDEALFSLGTELTLRLKAARKKNVFIDAHPDVNFGIVVDIMDLARESGASKDGVRMARLKEQGPLPPTSVGTGVLPRGVMTGTPSVVGSITQMTADRQLRPLVPKFRGCYEKALASDSTLTGRILLRIELHHDGKVVKAEVDQSSVRSEELTTCINEQLAQVEQLEPLKWPDDDGKEDREHTAAIIYPLLFSPG